MCNKKPAYMNSTGKFIQFLMLVTIYLMDSIQIGIFICKLVTHKIFQLTKAYMLTLLLIYYVVIRPYCETKKNWRLNFDIHDRADF